MYILTIKYDIGMGLVLERNLAIAAAAQDVVLQVIDKTNARDYKFRLLKRLRMSWESTLQKNVRLEFLLVSDS